MYRFSKKLCSLLLVLCMLMGIVPVGALASEDSAAIRFISQHLSLGDDLTMHFQVSVDAAYTENAVMTVTAGDSVTGTYVIKDTTPEEDGTYKFSVKLAAAQMTDAITLTLSSGDMQLGQKSYTVRDYAIALMTGSYTNETKALARELLNYGAKAQTYFNYDKDFLANTGYELESMAQLPADVTEMTVSDEAEGIAFYGASMVFENKLAVRYYFTAANGVDGYAFTVGEAEYAAQKKDGLYYIEVPGINPQDMDKTMELTVSGGSGELKIGYSPLNYFVRMYNRETTGTAMKELIQAAYSYHKAAAAYVGMGTVYTVSFSDGVATQQVESGACAVEPAVPVKTGYSFLGWYNGDVLYDFSQPVTGDISLTAKWEAYPEDMWNDFSDPDCADVYGSPTKTWLESYAGAEGVLKLDVTNVSNQFVGNTNGVNWPAVFDKTHYENAIGLKFRVKIEGDALNSMSVLGQNWAFSDIKLYDGVGATDGWQEYILSMDVAENFDALNGMFWTFWANGDMTVYIDQITVIEPENMWYDFSDSNCWDVYGSPTKTWLESYDGAEGVLKLDLVNTGSQFVGDTNGINWPAAYSKAYYKGAVGLKFRVKIEGDALTAMEVYGRNWGISPVKLYDGVGATDGWKEYIWTVDVTKNYDLLNGMFWTFWANGDMTVYIDQITAVSYCTVSFSDGVETQTVERGSVMAEPVVPVKTGYKFLGWYNGDVKYDFSQPVKGDLSLNAKWEAYPENMWYDFSDPNCWDVYGSPTKTWLESYAGAEGVLKLDLVNTGSQFVGDTNGINWPAAFDKTHYGNAVGLKFRVKIEGDALTAMEVYGRNWGISPVKLYDAVGTTDGWKEYIWTVDVTKNYDLLNGMFWTFWANGNMTVYIDQITAVSYCTVSFSDGVETQTVERGSVMAEPAVPVKTGYKFLGWYNGDVLYDFSQPVTGDISLTAKWEAYPEDMWNDFSNPDCADVYGSPTKTWLESYAGAEGVLKLDITNVSNQFVGNTNGVNWPAVFDKTHYENAIGLKFRVKIEGDALNSMSVLGQNWAFSDIKLYDGVGATDGWQEYILSMDVAENFDALNGMFWTFWANGDMTVYIDQITVIEPENMWYDFSDSNCWNVYGSPTKTWLESYDGAKGVLKLDLVNTGSQFVGDTNGINWPAAYSKAYYKGAVGLKFRVKIEGDALTAMEVYGRNWGISPVKLYDGVGATDGWKEYIWTVDVTKNYDLLNGMFWTFWANGDMTVYIDQITVVYE